jgi:hypothetical protein
LTISCFAAGQSRITDQYAAVEFADATDNPTVEIVFASQRTDTDPCKRFVEEPLTSLTVDTRPVDRSGQVELDVNDLPENCAAEVFSDVPTLFVACDAPPCGYCYDWPGAQFCHSPLYFEEYWLERYGYESCCQLCSSACNFFGGALFLPATLVMQPPSNCELTPPPY